MFLVKRICKTKRENLWEVASLLNKICGEYEDKGRSEATIYISGFSTPAKEYSVTAFVIGTGPVKFICKPIVFQLLVSERFSNVSVAFLIISLALLFSSVSGFYQKTDGFIPSNAFFAGIHSSS